MTQAYEISEPRDGVVILRFAAYVDQLRRPADDERAFALVDRHEVVVCDLSESVEVVSRWLKLLARMSDRARDAGKRVVLVGVRDGIRRSSDWLGLSEDLELFDTKEAALRQ
jgi:anti-anti-sigma regulatory factor